MTHEEAKKIGKERTEQMARDICSVQPMPSDLFSNLYKSSKSREDLVKEGYKPVSRIGLLWIKDE